MRRLLFIVLMLSGCSGWPGNSGGVGHGAAVAPPKPVAVKPFSQSRPPDVVLIVTGHNSGTLELCNCSGPMSGGLARRGGMIASYRNAFPHTLLIDSGDLFWIEPQSLRNDYVLKGYRQLGYDAITLADQEWACPPDRLRTLLASEPLPYVSTTVSQKAPPLPLKREVLREWGGVKVAVLSDIDRSSFLFLKDRLASLEFASQAFELRAKELRAQGYVIVTVAHGDTASTDAVANGGLADVVVRGHTTRTADTLQGPEESPWRPRGTSVGSPASNAASRQGGTNGEETPHGVATNQEYSAPIMKVGGNDAAGVLALWISDGRISSLEYRVELMDERWPLDNRLMQTYQAYAHEEMARELDADRKAGLDYVPSTKCGSCHKGFYQSWQRTGHARAYATLAKAGRQGDPNCLVCHTTGFGTASGFYTIGKTPDMANVNCQDCHRFGVREHPEGLPKYRKPGADVCATCHTPVTDPTFDYGRKVAKVHPPK